MNEDKRSRIDHDTFLFVILLLLVGVLAVRVYVNETRDEDLEQRVRTLELKQR